MTEEVKKKLTLSSLKLEKKIPKIGRPTLQQKKRLTLSSLKPQKEDSRKTQNRQNDSSPKKKKTQNGQIIKIGRSTIQQKKN